MSRGRYIGWVVMVAEGSSITPRIYDRCDSEQEARARVVVLNRNWPHRLFWAEFWSTSSCLDHDLGGLPLDQVPAETVGDEEEGG